MNSFSTFNRLDFHIKVRFLASLQTPENQVTRGQSPPSDSWLASSVTPKTARARPAPFPTCARCRPGPRGHCVCESCHQLPQTRKLRPAERRYLPRVTQRAWIELGPRSGLQTQFRGAFCHAGPLRLSQLSLCSAGSVAQCLHWLALEPGRPASNLGPATFQGK